MKQVIINELIQSKLYNYRMTRIRRYFVIEEIENIKHFYKPDVNKLLNELFKEVYSDQLLKEILNNPNPILESLKL